MTNSADDRAHLKTREDVAGLVEREAQALLGVSSSVAFEKLDRGELNGTIIEAELRSLRFLLQDPGFESCESPAPLSSSLLQQDRLPEFRLGDDDAR